MDSRPKALGQYLSKMNEDFEFNLNLLAERDRELEEMEKRERRLVAEIKSLRALIPSEQPKKPKVPAAVEIQSLREENRMLREQNQQAAEERESLIRELHEVVDLRGKVEAMLSERESENRQEKLDTATINMITKYRTRAKVYSSKYREAQREITHLKDQLQKVFEQLRSTSQARDDLLVLSNRNKSLVKTQKPRVPQTSEACVCTDPPPAPSPPPQPVVQNQLEQSSKVTDRPRMSSANFVKGKAVRTVSNSRKKVTDRSNRRSNSNPTILRKGSTTIRNYNFT
eukprot:TRINITY_DN18223_c0_g1_i1.p1 TRINITY_DN18223_c0_g1~~TRINITY_DN18223_c0_g1_i1.p1  ORF type:complete len:300 (+),score=61.93 TRINITY_DN18223_c0_g1_i1:48-902(+)